MITLEDRVAALEAAIADLTRPTLPTTKRRWEKRKLYEAIKPLRETGASWDNIGAAVGVCGERCRQVWRLFDRDNVGKTIVIDEAQKNGHASPTDRWVE